MNKLIVVQVSLLIVFAGSFLGMIAYTDVYEDIKSTIVEITCYSCIKMDPVTNLIFTFNTVNNKSHTGFIINNLTTGPVFLAFRQDVCSACDKMEPILKDIFSVNFGKKELFYETVKYDSSNITFFHINIDHTSGEFLNSFFIYDKDDRRGVPMFVIITLGSDSGIIKPYYATAYSTLGRPDREYREKFLRDMISQGIDFYIQNSQ